MIPNSTETASMNIAQLFLWCLENDVELMIKPNNDSRQITVTLKKTKTYVYCEDHVFTQEFFLYSKMENIGEYILMEIFERITNAIERPVQIDPNTGKIIQP